MEPTLQKAVTTFKGEDPPAPHRLKSLKPNTTINVTYSEINIHQYVREMSLCPSEAVALGPSQFPSDTFESLGKGPLNFLIVCECKHYDSMFLYLSKQTSGETFGCTDDSTRDQVTVNLLEEKMSKRHAIITFKDSAYTIMDLQSESGTWKRIVSYYGEPVCNAIYKIGDCTFTCYKGPKVEFVDEWLHKYGLLHLWDLLQNAKVTDLEKLKLQISNGFPGIKSEADRDALKKAAKNFESDYYEGCTKYRIVLQFIEGPMKGIETEVGLRGITFGGETSEINVFEKAYPNITGYARIVYRNGHYFLMNSYESPQLSFYKCNNGPAIKL